MPAEPPDSPHWAFLEEVPEPECPLCKGVDLEWDSESGQYVCECGGRVDKEREPNDDYDWDAHRDAKEDRQWTAFRTSRPA